jgi:AcrR family transcriptional regulator
VLVPRPPDTARREELFEAVLAAFAAGGVGGRSLREVADAVGTSHRMLLHHFGSRDELLLAVVGEVERRQMEVLDTLPASPAEAVAAMWASVRDPSLRPFERLFFECYARGAAGEEPFTRMVPAAVDEWLDASAKQAPDADPALARLALAATRGLLLDLVATDDVDGVDAAARRFIRLLRL